MGLKECLLMKISLNCTKTFTSHSRKKCTSLYDEMRQIKETFRRHKNRPGNSFLAALMNSRKLRKLQSEFDSLTSIIVRFENTLQFLHRSRGVRMEDHHIDMSKMTEMISTAISKHFQDLKKTLPLSQFNQYRVNKPGKAYQIHKTRAYRHVSAGF